MLDAMLGQSHVVGRRNVAELFTKRLHRQRSSWNVPTFDLENTQLRGHSHRSRELLARTFRLSIVSGRQNPSTHGRFLRGHTVGGNILRFFAPSALRKRGKGHGAKKLAGGKVVGEKRPTLAVFQAPNDTRCHSSRIVDGEPAIGTDLQTHSNRRNGLPKISVNRFWRPVLRASSPKDCFDRFGGHRHFPPTMERQQDRVACVFG